MREDLWNVDGMFGLLFAKLPGKMVPASAPRLCWTIPMEVNVLEFGNRYFLIAGRYIIPVDRISYIDVEAGTEKDNKVDINTIDSATFAFAEQEADAVRSFLNSKEEPWKS